MMEGAAFILLKAGRSGSESAKQAETRLADLLKILHIACFEDQKSARRRRKGPVMVVWQRISARYG
jgi:hypothetical protein